MVTFQSSELGWEVTVELPADSLSLEMGSVKKHIRPQYVVYQKHTLREVPPE